MAASLQVMADPEVFTTSLQRILGKDGEEGGIGGALNLLKGLNISNLQSSISGRLEGSFGSAIKFDSASVTGSVAAPFKDAIAALPKDPSALVEPLREKLSQIQNLSATELGDFLKSGVQGLQNVRSALPANPQGLIQEAASSLGGLKSEFISGSFGELRDWSARVQELQVDLAPLFAGGAGVEERLIIWLTERMRELAGTVLPSQKGPASALGDQLDRAITSEQIGKVNRLRSELIEHLKRAQTDFQQGNFTNTIHLSAAEGAISNLAEELKGALRQLDAAVNNEAATTEGMTRLLDRQMQQFEEIEIVDLGNIKDKFSEALKKVEESIRGLNLDVVQEKLDAVFAAVNQAIDKIDLSAYTQKLTELQGRLDGLVDNLDAVLLEIVAALRSIFTRIREGLRSLAEKLGSFDSNGKFHFNIQQEIQSFLEGVEGKLDGALRPAIDDLKSSVGGALDGLENTLDDVKGEIESVRNELQSALQGVSDQLKELDIEQRMEDIRLRLEEMLSGLGEINFDIVIDPVVAEINDMRDQLKKIDLSALNEILIDAFKVAVKVVVEIDFSVSITGALMTEFDKILQYPKDALKTVEAEVEGALNRLTDLQPEILLKPLDNVFAPITAQLDQLKLENLLKPIDAWHAKALSALEPISPERLLQPLVDLYGQLQDTFNSISPDELVKPIRNAIDELKKELGRIDLSSLAGDISRALADLRGELQKLDPAQLFAPLVSAFDKVIGALDSFKPSSLLRPFGTVFDQLTAPLDNLSAEHVRLIEAAFAPLKALPSTFDPEANFQARAQKARAVFHSLEQLNVGRILADLKSPFDSLKASFFANGGGANASLALRLDGLNPIRHSALMEVAEGFRRVMTGLQSMAASGSPGAPLQAKYNEIKEKVESLSPGWVREGMTADSIKRAFKLANPLALGAEIDGIYNAAKEKLQALDPRRLQERVSQSFAMISEAMAGLDPGAMLASVQGVLKRITGKLTSLDLSILTQELEGLSSEIRSMLGALDPGPIIQSLDGLMARVKEALNALKPSELLKDLAAPLESAQQIVKQFDPASFKKPLEAIFQDIRQIIASIDVGVVLKPFNDRLDQLRSELERGLQRTEDAFSGMIRAIPVDV